MNLLYLNEHLQCDEYATAEQTIFKQFHFKKGESLPEKKMEYSAIIFILGGEIVSHYDSFYNYRIGAGQMIFLPYTAACSGKALSDTTLLRCIFDKNTQICTRFTLENLPKLIDFSTIQHRYTVLPVRERIMQFIDSLILCLNDGLGCRHFHQLKQKELALLFRGYYNKEELAHFFYPILSENMDFKELVLANYTYAKDMESIAERMNLSPTTFNRRFKKNFGESFAQWQEKRKADDILREIRMTDKTFSEIANEYNFSSPAYFTTFCKRNFGKSPTEIRGER